MDYIEALAMLKTRETKKLENNTYLVRREDEKIAVRLHATDVVTLYRNGAVTLDSGGWRTVTTKDRINTYAPKVQVWSNKGIWQVARIGDRDNAVLFHDGIRIPAVGTIPGETPNKVNKSKRKLDTMVRKYIAGFVAHIQENGIEQPGPGDCWACYFSLSKAMETDPPTRNVHVLGLDHILSHMSSEETYYVPSLLCLAAIEHAPHNWRMRMGLGEFYSSRMAADDLRYYLRNLKPRLIEEGDDLAATA